MRFISSSLTRTTLIATLAPLAISGCANTPPLTAGSSANPVSIQGEPVNQPNVGVIDPDNPFAALDLDQYTKDLEYMAARNQGSSADDVDQFQDKGQDRSGQQRPPADVVWLDPAARQAKTLQSNTPTQQDPKTIGAQPQATNAVSTEAGRVILPAASEFPPILSLQNLINPFKGQLAREAADSSTPLRERIVSAALLMISNDNPVDPALLYDLTDSEKEIFTAYQTHFTSLRDLWDQNASTDDIRLSVTEFLKDLAPSPQLHVTNFKLCNRVTNFGLYEQVESTQFQAMRATPLLTYVEIEHFTSKAGADGKFLTQLRHELELYTENDGTLVYTWPALPAEDRCSRIRRDFFLPRQIALPPNLTTGRYRLKIRITDEQSQDQAEAVIPISIIAGGDWADNR